MSMSAGTDTPGFWDAHYGRSARIWSGRPNGVLVNETADLTPGRALDIGCGEGADAVWLAQRGWYVTAVDVSQIALDRGRELAKNAAVEDSIDWQWHDLAHTFPAGAYELVSAQYLHAPIELPRGRILQAAASAVTPGGTLLVVGHAAAPPWAKDRGSHHAFPDPDDTSRAIGLQGSDWTLVSCEVRERETISPSGEPATVTDSIVKAIRRSRTRDAARSRD